MPLVKAPYPLFSKCKSIRLIHIRINTTVNQGLFEAMSDSDQFVFLVSSISEVCHCQKFSLIFIDLFCPKHHLFNHHVFIIYA